MANVEMTIQLLEAFRDRDMWKEGFMTHDDKPKTRKNICGYAIETIKAQQAEIERLNALLKEQEPIWNDVLNIWTCPNCGQMVSTNYCRDCGRKLKWE